MINPILNHFYEGMLTVIYSFIRSLSITIKKTSIILNAFLTYVIVKWHHKYLFDLEPQLFEEESKD